MDNIGLPHQLVRLVREFLFESWHLSVVEAENSSNHAPEQQCTVRMENTEEEMIDVADKPTSRNCSPHAKREADELNRGIRL
jgi:hypothetical protein